MSLACNSIGAEGAEALASVLEKNYTLISFELYGLHKSYSVCSKIESLKERNQQHLKRLQTSALKQLKVARVLLFKAKATEQANKAFLPLEIWEKIINYTDGSSLLMTNEQQCLILNYAEGKIAPVADKLSFFKVTKCDKVMKRLRLSAVSCQIPLLPLSALNNVSDSEYVPEELSNSNQLSAIDTSDELSDVYCYRVQGGSCCMIA